MHAICHIDKPLAVRSKCLRQGSSTHHLFGNTGPPLRSAPLYGEPPSLHRTGAPEPGTEQQVPSTDHSHHRCSGAAQHLAQTAGLAQFCYFLRGSLVKRLTRRDVLSNDNPIDRYRIHFSGQPASSNSNRPWQPQCRGRSEQPKEERRCVLGNSEHFLDGVKG